MLFCLRLCSCAVVSSENQAEGLNLFLPLSIQIKAWKLSPSWQIMSVVLFVFVPMPAIPSSVTSKALLVVLMLAPGLASLMKTAELDVWRSRYWKNLMRACALVFQVIPWN